MRVVFPLIKTRTTPLKGIPAILAFLLCFLILWVLDRRLVRKMRRRTAVLAMFALVTANVVLQTVCLYFLRVKPSWDFGAIMNAAGDISMGRAIRNWGYFQEYPYNINPAVIIGTFQYLTGGFKYAPYLLNMLCVTSSITGASLLAFRLFGKRTGVLTALFFLGVTPMYLYIPIVYTDTLSMPFAIWTVYVWSLIRPGKKGNAAFYILIGVLAAMGFLIKQIAAIGLAAFLVDFLLDRKKYSSFSGKNRNFVQKMISAVLPMAVTLFSFVIAISAFRYYVDYKGFNSRIDYNKSLSVTHWLMMGMNKPYADGGTSSGYGGFSAEDVRFSRLFPTTPDKKSAELSIIRTRLRQFGIGGYARFLLKKMEWTWTDGTYFAPVKLARYPVQRNVLHKFVLFSDGKSNRLYRAFAQFIQAVLLFMILTGCVLSLRKKPNRTFRLMTLMCLGLMVFLLFWEARSRYLAFMLPVFVVMATYGMRWSFRGLDRVFRLGKRKEKGLEAQ